MSERIQPASPYLHAAGFTCVFCGVAAQHTWPTLYTRSSGHHFESVWILAVCGVCGGTSVWNSAHEVMVHPAGANLAPPPHPDMPEGVRHLYEEAASIVNGSTRAAAALLRVAAEMLLRDLTSKTKLNDAIAQAVKDGLGQDLQQALDLVRVSGNTAVHAGVIQPEESSGMTAALFEILNITVRRLINDKEQIRTLFDERLTDAQKQQIALRDQGPPPAPSSVPAS